MTTVSGVLLIDKPSGMTSQRVCSTLKRQFNLKKVGHTGALDPMATGMLPICVGEATKFAHYGLQADKAYEAEITLGITTATDDIEGEVISTQAVPMISEQQLLSTLKALTGTVIQVPPKYAALKHQGKPYYYWARKGVEIPVPSREVVVHDIELLAFADNRVSIRVRCGKGTYIRSIARDVGEALGCGATLSALRRLWVDPFQDANMLTLDAIADCTDVTELLLGADVWLMDYPVVVLVDAEVARLQLGQRLGSDLGDGLYRLVNGNDQFCGLVEIEANRLSPKRLIQTGSI